MFENIGEKIKTLVRVLAGIGVAVSVILGGIFFVMRPNIGTFIISLLIVGLGIVFAWIGSFFLYAYGELVANSTAIAKDVHNLCISKEISDMKKEIADLKQKSNPPTTPNQTV